MVFTTLQAWRISSVGMVYNFDDSPMWLKSNKTILKLIEAFGLSAS